MIRNTITHIIIPFYDSITKQNYRKVKSQTLPFPIFCKSPVFQIALDLNEAVSTIQFVNLASLKTININPDLFIDRYLTAENVILISKENINLNLNAAGFYYVIINDRGTNYYSEVFEIVNDTAGLFKITFSDSSDIENRLYQTYFKETVSFRGNIKNTKPFFESKSVKRSGEEYFTERVYYDQFEMKFNSYLNTALAIQRINLFDNIEITTPRGEVFTLKKCTPTISELNETGIFNITILFKTNRIFKNTLQTNLNASLYIKGLSADAVSSNYIYTDTSGYKYTMFYRTVVNPVTNNIIRVFKLSYSHTELLQFFYIEISRDRGVTYKSIDGTAPYNKVQVGQWINNPTPVYTKTGRLIVFFQWAPTSSATREKACWIYSDDDGTTWSAVQYYTDPPVANKLYNSYFYSNYFFYANNGDILVPYNLRVVTFGRNNCRLARSTDNGATFTDTGIVFFANPTGTIMEPGEFEVVQDGSHVFMIARAGQGNNPGGHSVPIMFYSSDYGSTWSSTGNPHTVESLWAKDNKCGFLYLEGANVSLGIIGATYNECLPSINIVTIDNVKWLVIFYWLRLTPAGQQTVQKWTVVKASDYVANGVNAIKNISQTLFDGYNHTGSNKNGGNGCADNFGSDLVFSSYAQESTTSAGGTTRLYNIVIRKAQIQQLIDAYNAA